MPAALLPDPAPLTIGPARPVDEARPPLAFVEVNATAAVDDASEPGVDGATMAPGLPGTSEPGWNLWGDLEG